MPTKRDVIRARDNFFAQYKEKTPIRTAFSGDGRGYATSNLLVSGRDNYIWARDTLNSSRFYPVLNRSSVGLAIDIPINVGYRDDEPWEEQVLGIHYAGLGTMASSAISTTGPHHAQHQFRGGDEVAIDSRLFLPGAVHPTNPSSMAVVIEPFTYFWNGWKRFEQTTTDVLTPYLPDGSTNSRCVLLAIDPDTQSLVYIPGLPFDKTVYTTAAVFFQNIPAPAGNMLPLGVILLQTTTTAIDWTAVNDNVADMRLHVTAPTLNILDRLRQLEGYTGNDPSVATTGAAASSTDSNTKMLSALTDVDTTGAVDGTIISYSQPRGMWVSASQGGGPGGGAPTTASYLTLSVEGQLSAERVLTGTSLQIIITDGGANGNATLSTPQNISLGASVTFAQLQINGTASIVSQLAVGKLISSSRNAVEITPWGAEGSATGEVRYQEAVGGSNVVGFKAPSAILNDAVWILPDHPGTSGQYLGSLGAGASGTPLYWATPATGGAGAPTAASYITLSLDGALTGERVLVGGVGIEVTDGGAGASVTIESKRYSWLLGG